MRIARFAEKTLRALRNLSELCACSVTSVMLKNVGIKDCLLFEMESGIESEYNLISSGPGIFNQKPETFGCRKLAEGDAGNQKLIILLHKPKQAA